MRFAEAIEHFENGRVMRRITAKGKEIILRMDEECAYERLNQNGEWVKYDPDTTDMMRSTYEIYEEPWVKLQLQVRESVDQRFRHFAYIERYQLSSALDYALDTFLTWWEELQSSKTEPKMNALEHFDDVEEM